MGYTALSRMKDANRLKYGLDSSVRIPSVQSTARAYGARALAFVRDACEDLKFDTSDAARIALEDSDGRSSSPNMIPYNMERDLDRLCLEKAIERFLASGSREDAFDVYYCYCEIFKPFGAGYDSTRLLLEMLSEHETNASSLLMKHRDHYSHSVYVFVIGLALYAGSDQVRAAYSAKYGLAEGPQAACHFLEFWGMTALFHDVGYPFEIAHQQMKAYVCKLFGGSDAAGFSPHVSYKNMDDFADSSIGDLNELYARAIFERLSPCWLPKCGKNSGLLSHATLLETLRDRGVHNKPSGMDYLYMDHAYFSGLIVAKVYLEQHTDVTCYEQIPEAVLDSFCAIILHNSLFKFTIRGMLGTSEPLSLHDGQPLSYILMLCDELQCWDRASYGQNSRGGIYAFDFDMDFEDGSPRLTYYYDTAYESDVRAASSYKNMCMDGYTKRSGAVRIGRSKFMDDIDEIVCIADAVAGFESDTSKPENSGVITVALEEKQKRTGLYLSDSNYLNLYDFALALNGRYCGARTADEMTQAFEEGLSLEYKLSNIAQAKGFASQLELIGCFYTDRPVDYTPVVAFSDDELAIISESEHVRWCAEKIGMGWDFGDAHVGRCGKSNDNVMRERTRLHHDLVIYTELTDVETRKDSEAMLKMLELIREFGGLTIYRM